MQSIILPLAVALSSFLYVASPSPDVVVPGVVEISVTGARSDEGSAVAMLFASADGFPFDIGKAAFVAEAPVRGGRATVRVAGVRAGRYSVVVFHDTDGNSRINRNVLGIPREGVGVSRFDGGRPRFADTMVDVPAAGARFTIGLNYR